LRVGETLPGMALFSVVVTPSGPVWVPTDRAAGLSLVGPTVPCGRVFLAPSVRDARLTAEKCAAQVEMLRRG
jgi:hypothetical protein